MAMPNGNGGSSSSPMALDMDWLAKLEMDKDRKTAALLSTQQIVNSKQTKEERIKQYSNINNKSKIIQIRIENLNLNIEYGISVVSMSAYG